MQIDSPEVFVGIFRIIDEGNVTERGEVKSQVFTVTCGGWMSPEEKLLFAHSGTTFTVSLALRITDVNKT